MSRLKQWFTALSGTVQAWEDRPHIVRLRQISGHLFVALMLGWLACQTHQIGWSAIRANLPLAPSFYMLLLLGYLSLPIGDILVYRRLWGTGTGATMPILLRKRIYNAAFIGYSGEVALMMWARRHVALPTHQLAHQIKDSNILSAAASTLVAALVMGWFLAADRSGLATREPLLVATAVLLVLVGFVPLLLAFKGRMITLPLETASAVFGTHLARFIATQVLLLAQWYAALPNAPFPALLLLLASQIVIGRIPILPNRELLFVGVGIGLSHDLALSQAAVAGLLVAGTALQQLLHLLAYLATSFPLASRSRVPA